MLDAVLIRCYSNNINSKEYNVIRIPFDANSALLLTALGFTHTHHPATWRDVGGPENGPKVIGGPAYDEWNNGSVSVYVVDGMAQGVEKLYAR